MADTDILIHTNNALNEPAAQRVIAALKQLAGVTNAQLAPHKDHLVMVNYDPGRIKATRLLGVVTKLGYNAQLIGL